MYGIPFAHGWELLCLQRFWIALITCFSVASDDDGYSPKLKNPSNTPTSNAERVGTPTINNTLLFPTSPSEKAREILTLLSELEFRKAFLVLSYIGRLVCVFILVVVVALQYD